MLYALFVIAGQLALAHDRWRARVARRRPLHAEIDLLHEAVGRLRAENDLLHARLDRLEPHRRPRYRPWERLAILLHRARYGLSLAATAKAFLLTLTTLVSWERERREKKPRLVQGKRPVNALSDLVAALVHRLRREWPRWGTRRIAGVLARLGIEASRTSVQRILRRRPRPARVERTTRARTSTLVPKTPNHMRFIDFTWIHGLLRSVAVAAILDDFSRKVLALRVAAREPSAASMIRLLAKAVREHGAPCWLVSDQGTQFTSGASARAVRRRGIRRRFGAVGKKGSIALLERAWRSLKEEYGRGLLLFRPLARIERDLDRYRRWANAERPHQGLDQRTPDEVYYARPPRPAPGAPHGVLYVTAFEGDRALPVLRLRDAA